MNKNSVVILLAIVLTHAIPLYSGGPTYAQIAEKNLSALAQTSITKNSDQKDLANLISGDTEFIDVVKNTLASQLNPDALAKRKCVFNLFADYEKECGKKSQQQDVMDMTTWNDLDVVCGPKTNPLRYLASQLDRTTTEVGRVMFYKKILSPEADLEKLRLQQDIVKTLVDNQELFNELDAYLKPLAASENAVLSFWDDAFFCGFFSEKNLSFPIFKSWYRSHENVRELYNRVGFLRYVASYGLLAAGVVSLSASLLLSFSSSPLADKFLKFAQNFGFDRPSYFGMIGFGCLIARWLVPGPSTDKASRGAAIFDHGKDLYYQTRDFKTGYAIDCAVQTKLIHVAT